jgi:hypothetical protein
MKNIIIAATLMLILSVGNVFAQGTPPGFQPQHYGKFAFSHHHTESDQCAK